MFLLTLALETARRRTVLKHVTLDKLGTHAHEALKGGWRYDLIFTWQVIMRAQVLTFTPGGAEEKASKGE